MKTRMSVGAGEARSVAQVENHNGDPANEGVAGTAVTGDGALASLKVSLCFFWPLRSGQSL